MDTHPYRVIKDCGFGRCWSRIYTTREEADAGLTKWRREQPGGDWRIVFQPDGWMGPEELLAGNYGQKDGGWGGAML